MSSLSRGITLLRRAAAPAATFGVGYTVCWVRHREESASQLAVVAAAGAWSGLARGARRLGTCLPADSWPREHLAKVEGQELRLLINGLARCDERGLASSWLARLVLRRLCEEAQADAAGPAVRGLGAEGTVGGLPELAAGLDTLAAALQPGEGLELLPALSGSLRALVTAGGPTWHEALTPDGVLHVARAGLVASVWFAGFLRSRQGLAAPAAAAAISDEDERLIAESLQAVWEALGRLTGSARVGTRHGRSDEAAALLRDVQARHASLQAAPPPPPAGSMRPAEDALPAALRHSIATALAGGGAAWTAALRGPWGGAARGSAPAAAAAAPKASVAAPPAAAPALAAEPPSIAAAPCDDGTAAAAAEDRTAAASIEVPAVKARTTRAKVDAALGLGAWAALLYIGLAVASDDGLGLLRFHALPEKLRDPVKTLLLQRAVQVEELLAKYEPETKDLQDAIVLGPASLHDSYIQMPDY